jgi:redox-sensitive bicupin YhaK (pirin superfamily)
MIDVRRANDRFATRISWLDSKHSFSFGHHYDPDGAAAIRIRNKHAALYVARLQPGDSVQLPEAPYLHLFVARGAVTLERAGALAEGDAVRLTATGGQRVTAAEAAEVLVWEMHATVTGW